MEEDEANAVATLLAGTRGSPSPSPSKPSPKGGSASKRWRITPKALELLECVYAQEACPSTATRDVLALQLGATPRQVQVWFQNKRQRRAGKVKREQEAAGNGFMPSGVQDSPIPTQSSPQPGTESVPETVSTAELFNLPNSITQGAAPPDDAAPDGPPPSPFKPSSLSVYVPPSPESSAAPATTAGAAASGQGASVGAPGVAPPRVGRGNSLADLASVAECVDSLEHLTGGLTRVNSLKDLVALSRAGSAMRQVDLASLSKVVSLADLSSFANPVASQQQVA